MGIFRGPGGPGDATTDATAEGTIASTKAGEAAASAAAAASSASSAAGSATTASTSATTASTKATEASTSATASASSATTATSSASSATSSASTATTKASEASASAATATTKASEASTSATTATTKASEASTSATSAATSATTASTAATNAEASYDSFDDRYLGAKSSAPSTDNDGDALLTGSLYYNSSSNQLYVWSGSGWDEAAFSVSGAVSSFNTRTGAVTLSSSDVTTALTYTPLNPGNNLSEVTATTARTNLGLGALATLATVGTSQIDNDSVTVDKLANSINTAIDANTAKVGITSSQASAIVANTAKVTNATHTGDVTGATALTIANDAVTTDKLNLVSTASTPSLEAKGSGTQDGYIQLNCYANTHGIKLKSPPHSAGASYTLTFPTTDGSASEFLQTDGSGVLTWAVPTNTTYSAGAGLSLGGTTFTLDLTKDQSWTGSQRATAIDNSASLSFDQNGGNNFKTTTSGGGTLTFTNHTDGQSGYILLTNASNHAITAHANTKITATDLATISVTGSYLLSYFDNGTNAYITVSASYG